MQFLKNLAHLLTAILACFYYRFPGRSLTVVGITGTDGKTTTSSLVYHILASAGLPVALVTTVGANIGNKFYDTGFHVTTPSPFSLQRLMRRAVKSGSRYLVLEVTSHALDQFRTLGTPINIALITNISHDHLDYHRTFNSYKNAKAKILRGGGIAVLNRDDKNYDYLRKRTKRKIISFSLKDKADYTYKDFPFRSLLFGNFNKYNILAAFAVSDLLGVEEKTIYGAIAGFEGVPGRLENIKNKRRINIFIDFAHKPNALKEVILAVRTKTEGKTIVVFGCAGLRDRLKRPIMGEIAATHADYTVITAEDARTEDVRVIINQIAEGCLRKNVKEMKKIQYGRKNRPEGKIHFKIPDRQEAINFAIRDLAKTGDTVIVAGKGHEKSMCYGKIEYPWDEKKAILKALYGPVKNSQKNTLG